MPLYEYLCEKCQAKVEILQRRTDSPPTCGPCARTMKKMISVTSFALKGDGWARDNYGCKPAAPQDG